MFEKAMASMRRGSLSWARNEGSTPEDSRNPQASHLGVRLGARLDVLHVGKS